VITLLRVYVAVSSNQNLIFDCFLFLHREKANDLQVSSQLRWLCGSIADILLSSMN